MQVVSECITICLLNSSSACLIFCTPKKRKKELSLCLKMLMGRKTTKQIKTLCTTPSKQNKQEQKTQTQTKINKNKNKNKKYFQNIVNQNIVHSLTKICLKTSCVMHKYSCTCIKIEIWSRIKSTMQNKNALSRGRENAPLINTPQIP